MLSYFLSDQCTFDADSIDNREQQVKAVDATWIVASVGT